MSVENQKGYLMRRIFSICLLVYALSVFPLFAGEIVNIKITKQAKDELEITIDGRYESYRAFTLHSPFRFVIDFEGAVLAKELPRTVEFKDTIISKIRAGEGENRSRIVLDSAGAAEVFHSTIKDKDGKLLIKCWRSDGKNAITHEVSEIEEGATSSPVLPTKDLSEIIGALESEKPKEMTEEEKKLSKYSGEKITLDFYKTDIHNVFRLFAEISGKNIIVDDRVEGTLTISLKEVPWDLALEIILDVKNLRRQEKINTYVIVPKRGGAQQGELVVRSLSEEAVQPARLLRKEKENRQLAQDLILKAHNLESQGKRKQALPLYEQAFDLWKGNIDLIKKASYLHYIDGNFARGYYFAGEALKLNPRDAEAALYAALSAVKMGKKEEARLFFEIATKAKPKSREAFYNYGLFLEREKDYGKAMYIFQRYEALFGPSLKVSLAIARQHEALERITEACKRYQEIQFSGFSIDEETERYIQKKINTLCSEGED